MKKGGNTLIKEIAEHLGLSPGTVSIVLNGRGDVMRISKATQQRVRDAAKEMNYQPNIYARRLRSAATESVSRIVAIFWSTDFSDDIMDHFFKGMHRAVKEKGYNVEFFIQLFDHDQLSACKAIMSSTRFSGILVNGASDMDTEFLSANEFDLPIVLINRYEQRYHCVYINDYEIGKSSGRLFYTRNHKKVGLISMKSKAHGSKLRQMGFLESCDKYKLEIRPDWIQEAAARDYISGYEATQGLLLSKERPTALFVMAPNQVLGVVQACKDAGLLIPKDVEVLTYGDNEIFEHFSPSISSVYIPVEILSENALNLLILVIENDIDMPMSRMLYAEYVFRDSCGGFMEAESEKT
jgi:LacI family transcriptional regulator